MFGEMTFSKRYENLNYPEVFIVFSEKFKNPFKRNYSQCILFKNALQAYSFGSGIDLFCQARNKKQKVLHRK
jgi:transposase-like protein